MLSSLLIYSIVMIVMPQSYKVESNERFNKDVNTLISKLQQDTYTDGIKSIHDFCLENNAIATLEGSQTSYSFGSIEEFRKQSSGVKNSDQSAVFLIQFKDTRNVFTLSIIQHLKIVNEITQIFYQIMPWIMLLILTISAISSWICSRLLAKPVVNISRIANKMSDLDMTWHCDVKRSDELGVLTSSLNTMAQRLNETMRDLENANHQLQLDIDKERQQEKQRRDFFAAVSHELKTPITIAKGQIESMIYGIGDYKNTYKYLPETLQTMQRMEALVKEILTVSKLNSDELALHKEHVNLHPLIVACIQLYEPIRQEKEQQLVLNVKDVVADIDVILFKKAISNILNNAITYSPQHAIIRICLDEERLQIKNSGVHIDDAQLPKLFHPLYRLEQSRNTAYGGSGLGLYIVKNIMTLHSFTCCISNSEEGVVFTLDFHDHKVEE